MKKTARFSWEFVTEVVAMFIGAYVIYILMSGVIKFALMLGLPAFIFVGAVVVLWWIIRRAFLYRTSKKRARKRATKAARV